MILTEVTKVVVAAEGWVLSLFTESIQYINSIGSHFVAVVVAAGCGGADSGGLWLSLVYVAFHWVDWVHLNLDEVVVMIKEVVQDQEHHQASGGGSIVCTIWLNFISRRIFLLFPSLSAIPFSRVYWVNMRFESWYFNWIWMVGCCVVLCRQHKNRFLITI